MRNIIKFPDPSAQAPSPIAAAAPSRQGPAAVIQFGDAVLRRQARAQLLAHERKGRDERDRSTDDEWYRAFGRQLFEARIKARVSIEDAAAAAGRTVETWHHYEVTGRGRLMYPLLRFARRYDISIDDIFDEANAALRRSLD